MYIVSVCPSSGYAWDELHIASSATCVSLLFSVVFLCWYTIFFVKLNLVIFFFLFYVP